MSEILREPDLNAKERGLRSQIADRMSRGESCKDLLFSLNIIVEQQLERLKNNCSIEPIERSGPDR